MAQTFQDFIASERERLNGERAKIFDQQQALEAQLAEINKELGAIEAYEAHKTGKALPTRKGTGSGRAPQARKGNRREAILAVLRDNRDGLSRGELLEKMGLRGDKTSEMSISNALTALTKNNQVSRKDGKYIAA
jgi:hypothetical protein